MRIEVFITIFMCIPIIVLGFIRPAYGSEWITAIRFFLLGVQVTCLVTMILGPRRRR